MLVALGKIVVHAEPDDTKKVRIALRVTVLFRSAMEFWRGTGLPLTVVAVARVVGRHPAHAGCSEFLPDLCRNRLQRYLRSRLRSLRFPYCSYQRSLAKNVDQKGQAPLYDPWRRFADSKAVTIHLRRRKRPPLSTQPIDIMALTPAFRPAAKGVKAPVPSPTVPSPNPRAVVTAF